MRRWFGLMLTVLMLCSFSILPAAANSQAEIDPHLRSAFSAAGPLDQLTVIFTYEQAPSAADVARVAGTGALTYKFSWLPMIAARGTKLQLSGLLSQPGLVSAYLDRPQELLLKESVPYIGADRVWNELGYTGRGVTVAILDSGVDGTHPDLASRMKQNIKIVDPLVAGSPLWLELPNTDTSSGHGTHVAGTVAGDGSASGGYYTGVAPGADLVGIGAGDALSILFALQGFEYIGLHPELGIDIVSNSWGSTGAFAPGHPINVATKQLHGAGVVVVFASGNAGPGDNTLNPYSVAPWVIGVAAGDKQGQLASFSSRGIPGDPLYHPTLTAPGVKIVATRATTGVVVNGLAAQSDLTGCVKTEYVAFYTCISGTSMATPHVSGVVALMLEAKPGLHPDIVKQLLVDTARPMFRADGTAYQLHEVGAGYVDAYAAVQKARRAAAKKGLYKDKNGKVWETYSVTTAWNGTVGASLDPLVVSEDRYGVAVGEGAVKATARIEWGDPVQDLDMEVLGPDGAPAGSSGQAATNFEESSMSGDPTLAPGTYTVIARGWLNVGTPYQGSLTVEYILK